VVEALLRVRLAEAIKLIDRLAAVHGYERGIAPIHTTAARRAAPAPSSPKLPEEKLKRCKLNGTFRKLT